MFSFEIKKTNVQQDNHLLRLLADRLLKFMLLIEPKNKEMLVLALALKCT